MTWLNQWLERRPVRYVLVGVTLLVLVGSAVALHLRVRGTLPGREDVLLSWKSGVELVRGQNPYAHMLEGDMRKNHSYPTYFPGFYLAAAGLYELGVTDFETWLWLWRPVCEAAHLLIAVVLLFVGSRRAGVAFGVFAACFWFFNRWTLAVVNIAHLETPALLLFLLSMATFDRHRAASLLLLGLSLTVKQIALFVAPLYLIWSYVEGPPAGRGKRAVVCLAVVLAIPLAASLPFLWWNAEAYVKSILFSGTREPAGDFGVKSLDAALGLIGLPAKVPMLVLMGLVYVAALGRRVGRYSAALLVQTVFLDFNSVLFFQYMVWTVPLLPLAALEWGGWGRAKALPPDAAAVA